MTNLPKSKLNIDIEGLDELMEKYSDEIKKRQKAMDNKPLIGIEVFEELGIFRSAENRITRFKSFGEEKTNYISYSINFYNNSKHTERFTLIDQWDSKFPTLNYNPNTNQVSLAYDPSFNAMPKTPVTLEKLSEVVKRRFSSRKIELVNGWGIMHYLDLLTDFRLNWSDDVIEMIDRQVSNGTPLNTIANLLFIGVPLDDLEECIDLPLSWVKKAYTFTPAWDAKLAQMAREENVGGTYSNPLPPSLKDLSQLMSIHRPRP